MRPKYQIFISSTSKDLKDARQSVIQKIWNMGHIPVGTELFKASDQKHWDYISQQINECDFLILIVSERYGSIDKRGKSYTQREYEFAIENGVPTIAFLLDPAARQNWPVETERIKEIEALRELCSGEDGRLCKYWSDVNSLASATSDALMDLFEKVKRPGLVKPEAAVMDRLGLNSAMPHSKKVSDKLSNALKLDLELSRYFREDQYLHFEVSKEKKGLIVKLRFTGSIIPLNGNARVFRPRIDKHPQVKKTLKNEYRINGLKISDPYYDVRGDSRDELVVHYQLRNPSIREFIDAHFWPCPVLGYTVRFERSKSFCIEVGKITGSDTDSLEPVEPTCDLYTEYISKAAAFSSQGLRWKLKRLTRNDLAEQSKIGRKSS